MANIMLENLIIYFIYKTKGYITKRQLVCFIYLADLYMVKWTEKQLTPLDWRYSGDLPYHEEIDNILNKWLDQNLLRLETEGNTALMILNQDNLDLDRIKFPKSLDLMLDNIRTEWAGLTKERNEALQDYIRTTEPIQDIQTKSHNNLGQEIRLNLKLERKKLMKELGI